MGAGSGGGERDCGGCSEPSTRIGFSARVDGTIALAALIGYGLNRFVVPSAATSFAHAHFNDLLAMGVLLPYSNAAIRLWGRPTWLLLHPGRVLSFALVVGLFWEYSAPYYVPWSVSDPWDVLAYVAGGAGYLLVHFMARYLLVQPSSFR